MTPTPSTARSRNKQNINLFPKPKMIPTDARHAQILQGNIKFIRIYKLSATSLSVSA